MSYRSLLINVTSPSHEPAVTATGLALAEAFDAHLAALHLHVPTDAAQAAFAEFPVWGSIKALQQERARAVEHDRALREAFETQSAQAGVGRIEWRFGSGEPVETISAHARYADLVIMAQRARGSRARAAEADLPAAVAIQSARPVLLLPPQATLRASGNRILVAWDASREATLATTTSLPLLKRAESVDVVIVGGDANPYGDEPGADIALYLARHGVNASVSQVARGTLRTSEVLMSVARERGADLLCMGAYGHSRLKELVLGGVTYRMLRHMTLPVLLAG